MYMCMCVYTCVMCFDFVFVHWNLLREVVLKERELLGKDQYTLHTWVQLPENCAHVS